MAAGQPMTRTEEDIWEAGHMTVPLDDYTSTRRLELTDDDWFRTAQAHRGDSAV